MAEYIEREKVIHEIDTWLDSVGTALVGKGLSYYGELLGCVEDVPAADVAPVVHGRWETANDGTRFCSHCGYDAPYTWDDIDRNYINSADDVPDRISNYCPRCGAKMDLEEE